MTLTVGGVLDTALGQALADASARMRGLESIGVWSVALDGLRDESRLIRETLGRQLQVLERGAIEVRAGLQRIVDVLGRRPAIGMAYGRGAGMPGDAFERQNGWQRGPSALPDQGALGVAFHSLQFNGRVQELSMRGNQPGEANEKDLSRQVKQVASDSGLSSNDVLDLIRLMLNQGMDLATARKFLPDAATFSYGQGVPLERTAELTQRLHEIGGVTDRAEMRAQLASLARRRDLGEGSVELLSRNLSGQLYASDPQQAVETHRWLKAQLVEGAQASGKQWLEEDAKARMGTRQGQLESLENAGDQVQRDLSNATLETFGGLVGTATEGLGQASGFIEEYPRLAAGLTAVTAAAMGAWSGLKLLGDAKEVYRSFIGLGTTVRSWGGRVLGHGADIATRLGSSLKEGVTKGSQAIGGASRGIWQRTSTWVGNAGPRVAGFAGSAWSGAGDLLRSAGERSGALLGSMGRGLLRRPEALVYPAIKAYQTYTSDAAPEQKAEGYGAAGGALVGGLAGMEVGALAGAAIGSVVPVVGTAIGGVVGGMVGGALGSWGGGEVGEWIGGALYRTFGGDSDESESKAVPVGDIGSAVQRSVGTSDTPSVSSAASAAASPVVPTSESWTFSPQISISVAGNVSDPEQLANDLLPRMRRMLMDFSLERQRDALFDTVVV